MRTTLTLESDVEVKLRALMAERDISFKAAVNLALRRGLGPIDHQTPVFETFEMGVPQVDLTSSLQLAGTLEDAELARRLASGR